MGEAVGIDLGAAVAAAVQRRDDGSGRRVVVATSELAPVGEVGAALPRLADQVAGDSDVRPAVGVCVPALDPGDEGRMEEAAREAFDAPLLVLRPVAAAAWMRRAGDVRPDAALVVVEAEDAGGASVVVTVVQPDGEIRGRSTGGLLGARDPVRDAVDVVALALRSAWSTDVEVAVIGGAGWLAEVAVGITDVTGLPAVVPPDPQLTAASGAALLAGEARGGGGAALGLGGGAVPAGMAGLLGLHGALGGSPAGPGEVAGAGIGMAVGSGAGPLAMGGAAGGAVGDLAGAVGGSAGERVGAAAGGLKVGPGDAGGAAGGLKAGPGDAGAATGGLKAGPGDAGGPGGGLKLGPADPGPGDAVPWGTRSGVKDPPAVEADDLGGGGGSKAPWRRVVDTARKRVLVVAPAVVVIVIVGGIGVRSCVTDPETENVVAAGEHEPGSDGDGDSERAGNGGRRGSDKDGVSEQTSTSVDASTATTAGRGVTTTLGTSASPAAQPQPGGPGPGPGGGETTTTAGEPVGDRTPPTISGLAGGGNISAPVPGLVCQYPTSTTLAARVSDDDSGVGSVVAYWSTSRHSGSIKLNPDGQGNYIGTLGPIQDQGPFPLPVAWYVEARDLAGNSARLDASGRAAVTLRECQTLG